jgi:hypothetical protein
MPTEELQRRSITFTEEAEAALAQKLRRLERQIRGDAIEEAVRGRGAPGEVTGSDINRAYFGLFRSRRLPPAYYRDVIFRGELPPIVGRGPVEEDMEPERESRPKTYLERIGTVYIKVGLIVAVGGVLFPLVARLVSTILHASKQAQGGFLVAAAGLLTALFGYVARSMAETKLRQRK